MLPLTLYDIPSKLPGKSWSPNTTKTRFILGYKNLPFDTVWIECPDLISTLKGVGATPSKLPDGSKRYTVPVLGDPNTGALITDSWAIAEYLDNTYPEKPIFPNGIKGLIDAFESAVGALGRPAFGLSILRTSQNLNECSLENFIDGRETVLREKIDEWSPEGPKREAQWEIIEKSYYKFAKSWYDKVEGKWVMGDTFSYADIVLAARTFWFKRVFRDDEWGRVASLHDGRWQKLLTDVENECNLA